MKIAIMQPTFAPWIGQFDLIDYVDKFIFLDTVQYVKREWQNRNKFKVNGTEHYFSIPVRNASRNLLLKDALIADNFHDKLLKLLEYNYKRSNYFTEIHPTLMKILTYENKFLSKYNIHIIQEISKRMNYQTEFITLSETNFQTDNKKGLLIRDICKYFGASQYISPLGARDYLHKVQNEFEEIKIFYQSYKHPIYSQVGKNFISHLSIIDLLYNEGFSKGKEIVLKGRNYIS